jgi:hypothetical protein
LKPIPHPPPFQSALWPHLDLIRKLRLSRKSWPAIADELAALGVRIDRSALRKFFKRAQKGKPPLGFVGESTSVVRTPGRSTSVVGLNSSRFMWSTSPRHRTSPSIDLSTLGLDQAAGIQESRFAQPGSDKLQAGDGHGSAMHRNRYRDRGISCKIYCHSVLHRQNSRFQKDYFPDGRNRWRHVLKRW